MRAAIYTLGCKVNQYETQAMEQELRRRGHELVDFEDSADAYIINTCSVTAVSDKKSRQMIRRARRRSPGAVVAACGCYVQTHTDEAKTLGIDLIGGTGERMAFLDLLEQEVRDRTPRVAVDDSLRRRSFEVLPAGGLAARTRAMLKVEDGCVNFCTYCIIPFARGPVRSLPMDQAVAQTRQLQAEGYRELVFTGIEISSWGQDLHDGTGLIDLMEAVAAAGPRLRLRLGSLEPRTITEDFCRRAAGEGTLCALRLWNIGGRDRRNGEVLDFLSRRLGGDVLALPTDRRGNRRLAEHIFLEQAEKFDWPDPEAPESGTEFCHGLRQQLAVLWDGTVVPCCLDGDGRMALGNLYTSSVEEILASPRAAAIREGFSRRQPSEELCRRCGYAARF